MDISLDYIAGFFDGEGSVGIYPTKRKTGGKIRIGYYLRTQLAQTSTMLSERIFSELVSRYGGNIGRSRSSSGKLTMSWQLNGDNVIRFLDDVIPKLILKREQAVIALAWRRTKTPPVRDSKGRLCRTSEIRLDFDRAICLVVKALKQHPLSDVLSNSPKLTAAISELGDFRNGISIDH